MRWIIPFLLFTTSTLGQEAPDWLHFRPGIIHQQGCIVCIKRAPAIGADSDGDGMADDFEIRYGLDPKSREDAGEDPDNDQFTNYEEYRSHTNPTDPENHPAFWTRLRVTQVTRESVELRLLAINETGPPVMLRINQHLHAGEVGDSVQGVAIVSRQKDRIICRVNGENVTLEKGKPLQFKQPVVNLSFGDEMLRVVPSGETINLENENYRTHQLSRDGLLIKDLNTRKNLSFLVPARSREVLNQIAEILK